MDKRLKENLNNIQQNYIAPFLWLHNEDDTYIVREIERIFESGIRSVCLESRTHEEFCRDDWWSDIKLIFDECKKRDMNVWILDDKHFPSGYANGIFEEKYKDLQHFGITECHIDIAGPVIEGAAVADCWLESDEDEIVAVAACKHIPNSESYSEVIDITDGLSDGMVYFDLPEGMWRIVFMLKTRRGIAEYHLPFCDMLNPKTVDLFIKEVYEPHYKRFAGYFGNTFLGFFSDEPSFLSNTKTRFTTDTGNCFEHYPWHDNLKKFFADKIENLAGLWLDIENVSDDIRYKYMDLITKEYQKNFVEKIGKWCRTHNIMYIGHIIEDNHAHAKTGQGPGHYFRALSGQDMSGVDVVLHQIVPGLIECANAGFVEYKHMYNDFFHYCLAKLGSSFAHINPRMKGRAMCEIFGAYGWAEGTKIMKYLMDHMLVRGINYFVPHAFSPKPNDTDCPPNFYDTGRNPQYKFFSKNMDYLNRMSHMLNDGGHVSTCAILYDAENHWINKDFLPIEKIAKKLYDNLYDYDIIPVDYLDEIKDGTLNGEKYNVLIVPYSDSVPDTIIKSIKAADIRVITVSEEERQSDFENVLIEDLPKFMSENGFNDVKSDYDGICLRYYHYRRDGADIYMFVNEDINNNIDAKVELSTFKGGKYTEYDGFENKAVVKTSDNSEICISLPPYNSVMIVFGDIDYDDADEYVPRIYSKEEELNPVFDISVAEENSDEFKSYKKTDKLFSITGRGELPSFSGHMKYETKIELEKVDCVLDLGYVGEAAEVYLNGELIGTKQMPPYSFEISKEKIKDINKLAVVVSNHNGYKRRDKFSKFLLFEPSGIIGPIKIKK